MGAKDKIMKDNISSNSLFAFDDIKPVKAEITKEVLAYVEIYTKITAQEIAFKSGMKINVVVARLNELMYEHQAIKIVGNCTKSGRPRGIYSLRSKDDPLNCRKLTWKKKFEMAEKWIDSQQGNAGEHIMISKRKLKQIIKRIKEQ